jgi:hypothetical protein
MAKSFLTDINLNNNVLLNAKIQAWGSAPTGTTNPTGSGTAVAGQISSYLGALYIFNGTAWVGVGGGKVTIGSTDVNVNGSAVTSFTGLSSVTSTTFVGALTGNASTATTLQTARTINGTSFNGSADITVAAAAGTLTGATLASGVTASSLTSVGTLANLTVTNTITGSVSGNAGTATTLATARNINGVSFNGSANITVTAAADTLTGTTLNSGVTASSLTSVGTLNGLTIASTQTVSMGSNRVTNVGTPTADSDAATKLYVDSTAQGIDWKASVRAATTANGTLATAYANGSVIDGVTLATGNRILIKNQTTGSENGIYTVNATGAPTRSVDADAAAEIAPSFAVFVEEGTDNADCGFVLTNNGAVTVGTTALVFTQFTGLGQVTAGNGLTKTGNTLNAAGTTDRITVASDSIDIASTYAGQSTITTLGTVATGAWHGTVIAGQYGGTGVNNSGKTITLGGNLTTSGAHATTLTATGTTTVTLPVSGTLLANPASVSSGSGTSLTINAGSSTATTLGTGGGSLTITGGNALGGGDESAGGEVTIRGGGGSGTSGFGGSVIIGGGTGPTLGDVHIGRNVAGTAIAAAVKIGAAGMTTTIGGTVVVSGFAAAGFVKTAAGGTLSSAAIAYGDLPTASLTTATTTGIARKTTGLGTGTSAQSFAINHGFGQWVTAQLFLTSTGESVEVDVTNSATSNGTTTFTSAASTTNWTLYTYVIIG